MNSEYETIYERLLQSVAGARNPAPLVALWPIRGSRYRSEGLLVVGRAVYGWEDPWQASDASSQEGRLRILRTTRERSEGGGEMSWVLREQRRSAFWRVARQVLVDVLHGSGADELWPSRLCWSDLYKIAPAKNANPNRELADLQRSAAIDLLRLEVEEYRPKTVLVMAGVDWFRPFAHVLGLQLSSRGSLLEAVAAQPGRTWLVAKHPRSKPERPMVEEIRAALAATATP